MNKIESRHRLIRSIISERRILYPTRTPRSLRSQWRSRYPVHPLSRDVKSLNLVKLTRGIVPYYAMNTIVPSRWEKRLRMYMEDALVMLRPRSKPGRCKTLPGLAQSFGAILDALNSKKL